MIMLVLRSTDDRVPWHRCQLMMTADVYNTSQPSQRTASPTQQPPHPHLNSLSLFRRSNVPASPPTPLPTTPVGLKAPVRHPHRLHRASLPARRGRNVMASYSPSSGVARNSEDGFGSAARSGRKGRISYSRRDKSKSSPISLPISLSFSFQDPSLSSRMENTPFTLSKALPQRTISTPWLIAMSSTRSLATMVARGSLVELPGVKRDSGWRIGLSRCRTKSVKARICERRRRIRGRRIG